MELVDNDTEHTEQLTQEITLEDIAKRLDILGNQMNWLCENLQSLFVFVQQMGSSGGGIRGLMKMLKADAPDVITVEETQHAG